MKPLLALALLFLSASFAFSEEYTGDWLTFYYKVPYAGLCPKTTQGYE